MKDGKYYSMKYKRYAWIYHHDDMPFDCNGCGRLCKHPINFVWDDDEQNIEHTYGPECINRFKFERVED